MSATETTPPAFRAFVEHRADLINEFPDGEFYRSDVRAELREHIHSLISQDVILSVGSKRLDTDSEHVNTYTVARFAVSERAQSIVEDVMDSRTETICPCGHSGVRNCGEWYECSADICDREFARDELEVGR